MCLMRDIQVFDPDKPKPEHDGEVLAYKMVREIWDDGIDGGGEGSYYVGMHYSRSFPTGEWLDARKAYVEAGFGVTTAPPKIIWVTGRTDSAYAYHWISKCWTNGGYYNGFHAYEQPQQPQASLCSNDVLVAVKLRRIVATGWERNYSGGARSLKGEGNWDRVIVAEQMKVIGPITEPASLAAACQVPLDIASLGPYLPGLKQNYTVSST